MQFLPRLCCTKRLNSRQPYMQATVDLGLNQDVPTEDRCLRPLILLTLTVKRKNTGGKGGRINQAKYYFSRFCLLQVALNVNHDLLHFLKWSIF